MNLVLTNAGKKNEDGFSLSYFNTESSIYEVLRVMRGVPLFWHDHFNRLVQSVQLGNMIFTMTWEEFRKNLGEIIRLNNRSDGNIKFVWFAPGQEFQWAFAFIPHYYPSVHEYNEGVRVGLLEIERENPAAKIIQNDVREKANRLISENNYFEVLLRDHSGCITEGSRSNVFFVRNDKFYTAPAEKVLSGITRMKVLECLNNLNYPVRESAVDVSRLYEFDAVFLTGTSPKILPVSRIGDLVFAVHNKAVAELQKAYDQMIANYLAGETDER